MCAERRFDLNVQTELSVRFLHIDLFNQHPQMRFRHAALGENVVDHADIPFELRLPIPQDSGDVLQFFDLLFCCGDFFFAFLDHAVVALGISQRPEIAALRIEEGHWEGDTVVGKRGGKEAVVLSLLEKKTENYIAIRIPGKDADSVLNAMQSLREEFGDKFSQVFKTITVDNGSEFSAFSQVESWGSAVYFAHPYTSWERPQNERHNGLFRTFVPKGVSIEAFSAEYILAAADELNGRPRKKLGYRTPEELFDEFLDSVYAAEGCGSIAQDGSQRLPS